MPRLCRVPDPSEHVCDRVCHGSCSRCQLPSSVASSRLPVLLRSLTGKWSLNTGRWCLPAALRYSRDVSLQRELAETEAAQRKLAEVGAWAAAAAATVTQPDLEFRRFRLFCNLRGSSHSCP